MNLETSRPKPDLGPATAANAPAGERFVPSWQRFKIFAIFAVALTAVSAKPLFELARYAWQEELYTHILLIPFVTAFLIWMKRDEFVPESKPNRALFLLPLAMGAIVLMGYHAALGRGWIADTADYLAARTFAFLCFLLAGAFVFVPGKYLKSIIFPVAFLLFCVPFPKIVLEGIEAFFQHGSAEVAYRMLTLCGMPVFRIGTFFKMPDFVLAVEPECSGIHSSLVLFITSLIAAYLFLRTRWRQWVFVLSVIPLALLRNGFRVFCLGEIGVHFNPLILDSWFHHHGGPIFFLLSLVPLFLLLLYLIKSETRKEKVMAVR